MKVNNSRMMQVTDVQCSLKKSLYSLPQSIGFVNHDAWVFIHHNLSYSSIITVGPYRCEYLNAAVVA
jgi:hypothetical protein